MDKKGKEVFIMKSQIMRKTFAVGLCVLVLIGCAVGADEKTGNQENKDNGTNSVDTDSLYTSAAMTGSVVDFSGDGCTVSPAVTEDDGKTDADASTGYESENTNVVVTYQEDCVVQIATIHTLTGVAELEKASIADIKKWASIIIYGSFQDTHHMLASKIMICHYLS